MEISVKWVLCISARFWVLSAPASWSKHFFQPFSTFFLYFTRFSVIFWLKSRKNVEKLCFKLLFKAGWHANAGQLPEVVHNKRPHFCASKQVLEQVLTGFIATFKLWTISNIWYTLNSNNHTPVKKTFHHLRQAAPKWEFENHIN